MKIIKKIEINKFRSIFHEDIDLTDLTIFSGKNNAGKSNVLRALNLFFNGVTSFNQPYLHSRDYNQAYTGRAGGKREIEIKLLFAGHGEGALKRDFYITRKFNEDGPSDYEYNYPDEPLITDGNIRKQFTRFRNRIKFFYIPAVRDKDFVQELFLYFEDLLEVKKGGEFKKNLAQLSKILKDRSEIIAKDFETFINLETSAELSSKITDILGSTRIKVKSGIKIQSKSGKDSDVYVDLFSTGDGILMSYIPHFLNHISENLTNRYFVWGFEEPENSLEFGRAVSLSEKFNLEFKKKAQILITTHSPAFIALGDKDGNTLFRVYVEKDDSKKASKITPVKELYKLQQKLFDKKKTETPEYEVLQEELGIYLMHKELFNSYEEEINFLNQKVDNLTKATVITEGYNIEYLKRAKEFFDPSGDYDIHDGGSDTQIRSIYNYLSKNLPHKKVVCIWDPDYKTKGEVLEKSKQLLPLVLEPIDGRSPRGVEGLFDDKWFTDDVRKTVVGDLPGTSSTTLNKEKFREKILNTGQREDFHKFEWIFKEIKDFFRK